MYKSQEPFTVDEERTYLLNSENAHISEDIPTEKGHVYRLVSSSVLKGYVSYKFFDSEGNFNGSAIQGDIINFDGYPMVSFSTGAKDTIIKIKRLR